MTKPLLFILSSCFFLLSCGSGGVSLPEKDITFNCPQDAVIANKDRSTIQFFDKNINTLPDIQLPVLNILRYKKSNVYISFIVNGDGNQLYAGLAQKYRGKIIDSGISAGPACNLSVIFDSTHYVGFKTYEFENSNKYLVTIVGYDKQNVLDLMKYNFILKK